MIAILKDLLEKTKTCPEHPIYHPEGTTYKHILIVMVRALLVTKNIDLVLAGLFHDIMKPNDGEMISTPEGPYWSNQQHDKQAASLVRDNDDIRYFIRNYKGNYELIARICEQHMNCKEKIIKKARDIPFMSTFVALDDMVHRKPFPIQEGVDIDLNGDKYRNKQLYYVGQSAIQQMAKNDQFTITISSMPHTFNILDIPKMFFHKGQWDILK